MLCLPRTATRYRGIPHGHPVSRVSLPGGRGAETVLPGAAGHHQTTALAPAKGRSVIVVGQAWSSFLDREEDVCCNLLVVCFVIGTLGSVDNLKVLTMWGLSLLCFDLSLITIVWSFLFDL